MKLLLKRTDHTMQAACQDVGRRSSGARQIDSRSVQGCALDMFRLCGMHDMHWLEQLRVVHSRERVAAASVLMVGSSAHRLQLAVSAQLPAHCGGLQGSSIIVGASRACVHQAPCQNNFI